MRNNTTYALIWAIRDLSSQYVNGYEKAVLLILSSFTSDKNNISWYSQNSIADKTCFSISTVKRALKSLEIKGYISVHRRSKNGTKQTNSYKISNEKIAELVGSDRAICGSDGANPTFSQTLHTVSDRAIKKKEKKKKKKMDFSPNTQLDGAPLQAPPAADSVLSLDKLKDSKLGKYLTKNTLNKIQG